jgi:phosphonate transport system permease protein
MTDSTSKFDAILAQDRRQFAKSGIMSLAVVFLALVASQQVGLFDLVRLSEGIPAIIQLSQEMFPPNFSEARNWIGPIFDTLFMSVAGTALAILISLPLGLLAASNTTPHVSIYFLARVTLNILRAIPELIMGILFVAAVGFGALPGALALGLHSAGMVGKFFAEAIEHVDNAPVEAAKATGASSIKVIRYAVFPQVFSQMADVTIYRWEYNFRASTIMGMVGAGGIGFELMGSLRIMRYQEVFAILLLILVMVTIIDQIGAHLRKRLK